MGPISTFKELYLRYDGPIPERQRRIAVHASTHAFRRRRAHAMAARYSTEYGRILAELWRRTDDSAHGSDFPARDRFRDLGFYRRQRIEWDRHARELSASAGGARASR